MIRKTLQERLMEKIIIDDNGCWLFTGYKDRDGYGGIRINQPRKMDKAHRVSYKLFIENIPDGLCVLHHCDNPSCCNPEHLFLGTRTDNARDRDNKNRTFKGEQIWNSKLIKQSVLEIKKLLKFGMKQQEIADKFGVIHQTISDIKRGKTWKHIKMNSTK